MDRFDRVIDQFWTTATDRFQYAYDRDDNALYKDNLQNASLSELYHQNSGVSGDNVNAYDNLNRIKGFVRGPLSASGNNGTGLDTVSTASTRPCHSESWTLDALGNWSSQTIDAIATSRTHNSRNQLTVVGSNSLTFDNNGNVITDQSGNTYTYDAWNRLISVKDASATTIASYIYDGRRFRIREMHGLNTRDLYYSPDWKLIEERQGSVVVDQYVWSAAYVDGLILRDDNSAGGNLGISGSGLGHRLYSQQDLNWNTTALIDTGGTVKERFVYDPYGNVTVLDASGNAITDLYNWNYLHHGGRLDQATGLYAFRFRDYAPLLGRWNEQDLLGYADSLCLYLTCADAAHQVLDPSGLEDWIPPWVWDVVGGLLHSPVKHYDDEAIEEAIGKWGHAYNIPPPAGPTPVLVSPITKLSDSPQQPKSSPDPAIPSGIGGDDSDDSDDSSDNSSVPEPEQAPSDCQNADNSTSPKPSIPHPGDPPRDQPPGPGWEWRGEPPVGGGQGNWYNPDTGESLWNDMDSDEHDPHWDYRKKGFDGKWRWYRDGRLEHQP